MAVRSNTPSTMVKKRSNTLRCVIIAGNSPAKAAESMPYQKNSPAMHTAITPTETTVLRVSSHRMTDSTTISTANAVTEAAAVEDMYEASPDIK